MLQKNPLSLFKWTLLYVFTIVGVNVGYASTPPIMVDLFGKAYELDVWGVLFGTVFVTRDLAQHELGKTKVLGAMAIAALLTFAMVGPELALASVAAFICSETIDWAWYSFGMGSRRNRILTSSVISSPIDALVFLLVVQDLNPVNFSVAAASKLLGIVFAWYILPRLNLQIIKETETPASS